jgi:hypothetical protein
MFTAKVLTYAVINDSNLSLSPSFFLFGIWWILHVFPAHTFTLKLACKICPGTHIQNSTPKIKEKRVCQDAAQKRVGNFL